MVQVTIEEAPSQWPQLLEAIDRGEAVYVGDAQRRVRLVAEHRLRLMRPPLRTANEVLAA